MVTLEQKVKFLSQPATYGGRARRVEVRETHMSFVFLTEDRAYKLKKPVTYTFLDFSTVKKRRFHCEEELRLNHRLARETYRAVVPLCCDPAGNLSLFGEGRIVDWLVEMNRLPEDEMMNRRIREGRLTRADVADVAEKLCRFYREAPPQVRDGEAYIRHLWQEHAISDAMLRRPEFGLAEAAGPSLDVAGAALERLSPEVEARIADGRVVEAHGDLRPEHICLAPPVQIIDCLEFNRAMRMIDPYDEVSYLGLECEIDGASWVRPLLLEIIETRLGDPPSPELQALYGAFRALLRARLCVAHLTEKPVRQPEKWPPLARRYLEIAARESLSLPSQSDRRSSRLRSGA